MKKIFENKIFIWSYRIIKAIFIFGIILYLAFILIQRFSNNSSILGFRVFNVASASMEPLYQIGDAIVVKEVDVTTLKVGDNLTYLGKRGDFEGKIVTHALIKIESDSSGTTKYVTKGLANDVEDPSIEGNQIYGKVVKKLNLVSWISKVVRDKVGFFFLVFFPLVLVVFLEVADTIVENREEKKRKKGLTDEKDDDTEYL